MVRRYGSAQATDRHTAFSPGDGMLVGALSAHPGGADGPPVSLRMPCRHPAVSHLIGAIPCGASATTLRQLVPSASRPRFANGLPPGGGTLVLVKVIPSAGAPHDRASQAEGRGFESRLPLQETPAPVLPQGPVRAPVHSGGPILREAVCNDSLSDLHLASGAIRRERAGESRGGNLGVCKAHEGPSGR